MTATTTVRYTTVTRITSLLQAVPAMAAVGVYVGWPGDAIRPEAVWVGDIDGDVDIPVTGAGRRTRDDRFEIPLEIRVVGSGTLDTTYLRLEELVAIVEDVIADDAGLNDLDGIVAAGITRIRSSVAEVAATGTIGFAQVTISVHARLT